MNDQQNHIGHKKWRSLTKRQKDQIVKNRNKARPLLKSFKPTAALSKHEDKEEEK